MKKPWFGRKRIGWGWGLPQTWQGWCLLVLYIAAMSFVSSLGRIYLMLITTVIFIAVIAITSGRPQWGTWHIQRR